MITIISKGSFEKTNSYLYKLFRGDAFSDLGRFGQRGLDALQRATPVDTGLTADSWNYRVVKDSKHVGIEWYNTNIVNGTPVVILLQYGHGTGTGGYIMGRNFINPAIQPVFDQIAEEIWKKVKA